MEGACGLPTSAGGVESDQQLTVGGINFGNAIRRCRIASHRHVGGVAGGVEGLAGDGNLELAVGPVVGAGEVPCPAVDSGGSGASCTGRVGDIPVGYRCGLLGVAAVRAGDLAGDMNIANEISGTPAAGSGCNKRVGAVVLVLRLRHP